MRVADWFLINGLLNMLLQDRRWAWAQCLGWVIHRDRCRALSIIPLVIWMWVTLLRFFKQAVREAATICLRLCKLTFDLLIVKVMSESRVTWATSVPILVFLGLSVLDLGPMYVTDIRQTDVRRASSLNASARWGRGHNSWHYSHIALTEVTNPYRYV